MKLASVSRETSVSLLLFTGAIIFPATDGFASIIARPTTTSCDRCVVRTSNRPLASSLGDDVSETANRIVDNLSKYNPQKVVENLKGKEGEMGNRGEVWFAAQFVVIGCLLIGGVPYFQSPFQIILGASSFLGGVLLIVASLADLGDDRLSPFPKPVGSDVQTNGIYQQMRHPMYAGLLSFALGLSLLTDSLDRLFLTLVLFALLEVKSTKEEELLVKEFPDDYPKYQALVSQKFLPSKLIDVLPWNKE